MLSLNHPGEELRKPLVVCVPCGSLSPYQAFLTALAPAEIDALSRARREQSQADKAMRSGAEQQLERRRYEAALAQRQFNRVDPYNRLVAAELECRLEAALNEVRAAEKALARAVSPQAIAPVAVVKALNDNVIRLSGRLPAIWADPSIGDAARQIDLHASRNRDHERLPSSAATMPASVVGSMPSSTFTLRPLLRVISTRLVRRRGVATSRSGSAVGAVDFPRKSGGLF